MINRDLCIASALGNIEAWNPHVGITHSCCQKYRYMFFPQCLQQVSSKVCNFVNANIDDYKPLCNYLSHTSHLQIKWQLWALYLRISSIIFPPHFSIWIITCHTMFICSYYVFFHIIYVIHIHHIVHHISSISSHGPSPAPSESPAVALPHPSQGARQRLKGGA